MNRASFLGLHDPNPGYRPVPGRASSTG